MDLSRSTLQLWQAAGPRSAAIAIVALVLVTLALYRETVASLLSLWTHPGSTYHHGVVLVGIAAVLLYRRWAEVGSSIQVRPSLSAAALVLPTSLAWLLASLVDVLIVQQVSVILLLGLVVATVVGYRSARLFAFPIALLIFAVPVWDFLVPYLQKLNGNVAAGLLNLTGIPAFLQGTQISIPAGTFDVKPACSGVSQLIIGTMAGALFAYINRLRPKNAIWIVGASAGVALIANLLRVYITLVIGQVSGMHHYLVVEHWTSGWVLFGIGMFIFFFLATRWTDQAPSIASARPAEGTITGGKGTSAVYSACLTLIALVSGPVLVHAYQPARHEMGGLELNLPAEIGGWRGAVVVSGSYRPAFQSPDLEYERLYRDAQGHEVYLYVAEYVYQEQGKEAVYAANRIYDDEVWHPVLTRKLRLQSMASVRETRLESRIGAERLVWQWYYVHGFAVAGDNMAKLVNLWGVLNRDPTITAMVVAIDLHDGQDSSEATAVLERFVADTRPTLERAIDGSQPR